MSDRTDEEILEAYAALNNELANVQRELARANAQLARANADLTGANAQLTRLNEEKDRLLGMAAHDLRTPLGVIQGFAGFLEAATTDRLEPEERHFLEVIKKSSAFMLRLVSELLDVAAIDSGRLVLDPVEGDLGELVEAVASLQTPLAEAKGLTLEVEEAEPLPVVRFDRDRVQQVLNNLVSNAIKFSEAGGVVRLVLSREPDPEHGSDVVVVRVVDQGVGIPSDLLPQLFHPMGKAGRPGTEGEESTGLGLSIVRRMVEGHGGRVWAESTEGEGSTFAFTLPVSEDAGDRRAVAPGEASR